MNLCSRCGEENDRNGQRYCKLCHAAYMRDYRKRNQLYGAAKYKDYARSYAYVYLKRGKIIKKGCEVCGHENSQMHHDDYFKPLEVRWFCRVHHLRLHKEQGF